MANLQDNIRVSTQVDMQQLDELILKYKDLKVNVTNVAAAARAMSEIQKAEIRSILAAEQVAENERDGRSERRRLNKITNAKLETQAELDAIKIQSAASKAKYDEELKSIALYNAQMRQKALETRNAQISSNSLFQSLNSLTKIRSELITLFGAYSIGSFAQQMVEAQSKVESFQLSMKNLLGESYGAKLVADLKNFTVNTPLNFEEVISATNTLVGSFKAAGASSKTIGTEIPQILESLGNSAAALGGENRLGRLIYAFSQVQATGRLMGTEVRQITETGFPLLAVMSERSGKSVQQLQKDISDGKVSFEQFKEAILSAGKEGGVFAGSMDIMANTVRGRIDKMKEQVFFALANIGNQFNESAKSAIDFGSSVVQSLFGTESATKRTIDVLRTAITTWIAYQAATKLAASQTVIATAIDRASLIVRGQIILANISLTGSYNVLTAAEMEATAAARAFNTTAINNPLGLLVLGIGAVVGGYQLYKSSLEEAEEKQKKLSTEIANSVAPIKTQQTEFNNLAKAVLSNSIPMEEQIRQLNRLKIEHPILLKGVQDLTTAEKILNENKVKTNLTLDYRNEKFAQLKAKYPEQLKGIDDLSEAENKLAGIVRIANRDFAILSATMENNIRIQNQVAGANENFAKKIQAQAELAKLMAGQVGSSLVDFGGNVLDNSKALIAAKQKEIDSYDKSAKSFVKAAEVIRAENQRLTDKLVFNYNEVPKAIEKSGKEGREKALKYQEDTAKQQEILREANSLREQQQTRESEQKILDLEREYSELRVNNAKGNQSQKVKALQEIEKKYNEDAANLKRTWNKKDLDAQEKQQKELEKSASLSAQRLWDVIEKRVNDEQKLKDKALEEEEKRSKFKERIELQNIELQNDLAKVESKRYDRILDLVSANSQQTKGLFDLNDALRKHKDAKEDLIIKEKNLNDLIASGKELTKEGVDAHKAANDAKVKSTELSNALALTSYQLLYKAIEMVFNGIKNSIANSMKLVADSYRQSNEIFQEFVVKKREADLKNYENDLETRLRLAEGNFDMQLKLLDEYLSKAEQLMDERDIIDKFASDLEYLNTLGAEKNEQAAKMLEELSLNPLNNIKSMFTNTLNAIGRASDGLSKEQEKIYRQTISNSQNVVDKLEWQRDNTVEILDQMADAYRDKYEEQTRIIKDETDKQIDIVNNALDANLDKLSSFYDSQGDIIRTKYGDILDNNVRYTDTAFEKQLAIWNSARSEQETILISQRDAENQILKTKYEEGKITLDEYLASVASVNQKYGEALVAERTKFYDDLQDKADTYYTDEKAALDKSLADGLISREEYDIKLQTLDDIQKQRSKDIKSIVIKDRDDELAYLKTFYYDAKVLEEQKTADAILKINTEASTKLAGLSSGLATTIAGIEKQKRDTILSYNSQIFEENRKLALAEAELSKAQGKAAAWRNPFTAKATIRNIEDAFNEIISQILAAVNPFAAQRLNDNVIDNQTPVITDGNIFFEKGTDNTSVSLKGKPVVDNKGGKIAVLHEEEAVFSKDNMSEMTKALGYRPSRDEVIEKFKMGLVNMKLSHSPYVIPKIEAKGIGNVDKLGDKIDSLVREVMKKQTPQIIMNERGIKTYLLGVNSKIEAKMNRFK